MVETIRTGSPETTIVFGSVLGNLKLAHTRCVNFGSIDADTCGPADVPAMEISPVFDVSQSDRIGDRARSLLRKLRDLNLSAEPVAITRTRRVTIGGCLSLDAPAEGGVRYRLEFEDGHEDVLELAWHPTGLDLSVSGAPQRARRIHLACEPDGRMCSMELVARVSPESTDPRVLARFLKRVVRTVLRAA